jgi:hypothetical protein
VQQRIYKRGLAVIDMRDDRDVSDIFSLCNHWYLIYSIMHQDAPADGVPD